MQALPQQFRDAVYYADVEGLRYHEIAAIIAIADVKERFAVLGFEPSPNTPDESAVLVKQEGAKWAKVIADAHIKVE